MPFVRFRQFRLLWVVLASCRWFWLVLAGFGSFWLVARLITNDYNTIILSSFIPHETMVYDDKDLP